MRYRSLKTGIKLVLWLHKWNGFWDIISHQPEYMFSCPG